jgi:DNA-binding MarR family transcriptional regulator
MPKRKKVRPLTEPEYLALAEFRYQLRRFLRRMEEATRQSGVNPQQYQLVLAVKGLPKEIMPTISHLAERIQLNHNSMVELVDRCVEQGLLRRDRDTSDRRQVKLSITAEGDVLLRKLGVAARQELQEAGPMLVGAILRLTGDTRTAKAKTVVPKAHTGGIKKSGP